MTTVLWILLGVVLVLIVVAAIQLRRIGKGGSTPVGFMLLLVPLTFPLVPTPRYDGRVDRMQGETNKALIRRAQMREALDRSWR